MFHQGSGAFVELESAGDSASTEEPMAGDEVSRGTQAKVPYVAIRAADARRRAEREYERSLGSVPAEQPDGPPMFPPAGCAYQGVTFALPGKVLSASTTACDQAQENAARTLVFSDEFVRDAEWIDKECAHKTIRWSDIQSIEGQPLETALQRIGQPDEAWRSGKNAVTLTYHLANNEGGAKIVFDATGSRGAVRTK
jgi:hypothetical protein